MRKLFYTMMIAALTVANVWAQEGTLPTITLTTEKGVGETLSLIINAKIEDENNIWIDLDGDGVRNPDGSENVQRNHNPVKYTIKAPAGTPIKIHGHLTSFHCSSYVPLEINQITTLDVSKASIKLEEVICSDNNIKKLNVANLPNLKALNCNNNREITQLFLDNNEKLEVLACEGTSLSTLDVSANTELKTLNCANNKQLTSLSDLSYNKKLSYLKCYDISITELDVTQNTELKKLLCYNNPGIKYIDVSKCLKLDEFHCHNNSLSTINVENNKFLTYFYCNSNDIKEINLTNNTELLAFRCDNNPITALDFSNNNKLKNIVVERTNMDACALDKMYKSLPNRPETRKGEIWVKNTVSHTSKTKIASDKNWTVIDETGDGTGCNATNIDLQESNNVVSVYPNPATDYITVSLPDSVQGGTLVIADLSGKTVVAEPITDNQLNVSVAHLAKGVYIVKVGSTVEKLIVK